jgi:membrane fusion protein (multidrug efflux system)
MNTKLIASALAVIGLGGLGWYAYTSQRQPPATGFEVRADARKGGDPAGAPGAGAGAGAPAAKAGDGKGGDGKGPGGPGGGGPGGGPRGPVGVEVVKVETRPMVEELVAVGSLRANETVTLRPEVAGRIDRVGFTDGQRVSRGAVLVSLDASVAAAEVEQSRAELALARANHDRTVELAQRNFVSASAKDQAAANLKVQEAKLRLAEAKLAKSEIRAPFNGVMGLRNVSPGDFVKDGADLAVIEDIATMKVDLRMPERFFGRVKPGQPVQLSFDSLPGRTFGATIKAIDAQIDANGRSLLARGQLANPDGALRTGMFARARVVLRESPEALSIPEESVIAQGNDTFVWKAVDGKAVRTKIQIGLRRDARVEVLAGLTAGDLVVTAGQLRLQRDGQEVRVIDPNRKPGGGGGTAAAAQDAAPGAPAQAAPGKVPAASAATSAAGSAAPANGPTAPAANGPSAPATTGPTASAAPAATASR